MTVSPSSRISIYHPVVETQRFQVEFPIFGTEDLTVYIDDVETGAYSIDATFENGRSDDAYVELAYPVTGVRIVIEGTKDVEYATELSSTGPNLVTQIADAFSRLTAMVQEVSHSASRSLKLDHESSFHGAVMPDPEPGRAVIGTSVGWENGPSADEIASAQTYANNAAGSASDALTAVADVALAANYWDYNTKDDFFANTDITYTNTPFGTAVRSRKEGFSWVVAPSAAADHQLTVNGIKYYVKPDASGVLNFDMMNPAADGVTDDFPKLRALLDVPTTGVASVFYASTPAIFLPNADYFMSQAIELKRSVRLFGNDGGLPSTSTARLVFATDTMGIIVHRYNTIGSGVEDNSTGADGSILSGFRMASTPGSDDTKHGIWLRARAVLENLQIDGFSGNGIHIVASATGPDAVMGNANNFVVNTVRIIRCGGSGLYIDGPDVNAGVTIAVDAAANGRWGIYDSSFLGNTHIGSHTASNGRAGSGNNGDRSSFVSFGGRRYSAHPEATEAELVATEPGTDGDVWHDSGSGGSHPNIPLWQSGQPEGTYIHGGSYFTDGANAQNLFVGAYSESGAAGSYFDGPTQCMGGSIYGAGFIKGGYIRGDNGNKLTAKGDDGGFSVADGTTPISLGGNDPLGQVLLFGHADDTPAFVWRLNRSGNDWVIRIGNSGSKTVLYMHGENTTLNCGTSIPQQYIASFPKIGIGSGNGIRRQTTGTSAPASGEWGRGDIVWSYLAAAGGKAGWICTTAGTGGSTAVFKQFGAIDV